MNKITIIACTMFGIAIAMETAIWLTFLRRLKIRHPLQWLHAAQPVSWQDRTATSARSTMLYLHSREYLSSLDWEGIHYCGRNRTMMLAAYWLTALTGTALVFALALFGW